MFGLLPKVTSGSSPIDAFIGDFMHEGGRVGESGTKAIMPASLFNNAPRLHGGLAADEFPAILQKGETVIPKKRRWRTGHGNKPEPQHNNRSTGTLRVLPT